jgi:FkbM family methyltransferase
MLIFDIGSNIGAWALKNYTSETKIICVEASPSTYEKLINNIVDKNIIPLNFAVTSSTHEQIDFFESSVDTISTLNEKWLNDPSSRFYNQFDFNKITVNTISLDKLISLYGIPDLLKVDVEGAEDNVLKSLTKQVKTICFEWASEMEDIIFNSIEHLDSLGYRKFHIQHEDAYDYKPIEYEFTKDELIDIIKTKIPKVDWGMIWTTL